MYVYYWLLRFLYMFVVVALPSVLDMLLVRWWAGRAGAMAA